MDEYDLAELSEANAPYDMYGVGTRMGVSADAPWLDMAYKLVDINGRPVLKLSTGKISLPGPKQIFRSTQPQGQLKGDLLGLRDESHRGAEPLLKKVMENARRVDPLPSLKEIRTNSLEELEHLDERHKSFGVRSLPGGTQSSTETPTGRDSRKIISNSIGWVKGFLAGVKQRW